MDKSTLKKMDYFVTLQQICVAEGREWGGWVGGDFEEQEENIFLSIYIVISKEFYVYVIK
jgi:hypothetical protein